MVDAPFGRTPSRNMYGRCFVGRRVNVDDTFGKRKRRRTQIERPMFRVPTQIHVREMSGTDTVGTEATDMTYRRRLVSSLRTGPTGLAGIAFMAVLARRRGLLLLLSLDSSDRLTFENNRTASAFLYSDLYSSAIAVYAAFVPFERRV